VEHAGRGALRFDVTGPVQPLLGALADHPVLTLSSRELSLEEIFLQRYGSSDGRVGH
jgi:ABC-2 type transport system ATP-binding protein